MFARPLRKRSHCNRSVRLTESPSNLDRWVTNNVELLANLYKINGRRASTQRQKLP